MLRIPGMPFLPGYQFRDLSKNHYPRSQTLMNCDGISMLSNTQKTQLVIPDGTVIDLSCPPPEMPSLNPPKLVSKLPPWLVYDKKVLCFNAYFKESLQEFYHAPYQVRKVKIFYYLEDGTMQIVEPKVENSGIPQGCLVHRQRVPKPTPCQNDFISILDLNVDTTIQIFDRMYHITGCDLFTRHFLNRSGISVPDPVKEPHDPITELRKRSGLKVHNTPPKKHAFAQFLEYDRRVLKFKGYWDDRSEFGDVRKLEICYYLADDTIDIREILPRNAGREGPSTFLKRGKLPREFFSLPLPGEETDTTLLNVLGTSLRNVRYVADPLDTGRKEKFFYKDSDLQIGSVINVYGRAVVLTSCDEFTQTFYKKKYGLENFTPVAIPNRSDECNNTRGKRILPPYNGWGTYEDSEGNCISVEPKPPQIDFKKFIQFDRRVLRFGAKLLSTIRENSERVFVISYYLSDDTIQIYEVAQRNSGFQGGEFMKRTRIPLPGQDKFTSARPEYYKPHNLYIGATVSLRDHIFHVVSADEYTLIYMENHPFEFPMADVKTIMNKVRHTVRPCYKEFVSLCQRDSATGDFPHENCCIKYDIFKQALLSVMGERLTKHEVVTLCRYFSAEQTPPQSCNRDTVRAAVQLELKRTLWNGMDDMHEHMSHVNPMHKKYLPVSVIRSTLKGCRLPLSLELIDDVLAVLRVNDCGEIEVSDMFQFLNMSCDNVPDIAPVNIAFELCPKIPFLHRGRLVNFPWFLESLGLEAELKRQNE